MTKQNVIDNVNGLAATMREQSPKGLFLVIVPDKFKDDNELKRELLDIHKVVEIQYGEGNTCSIVEKT